MGYEAVKRMHVQEFEMNWAIQQAVIKIAKSHAEGSSDASVRRTLALEASGKIDVLPGATGTPGVNQPFDPERATPEEFAAWLAKNYPN